MIASLQMRLRPASSLLSWSQGGEFTTTFEVGMTKVWNQLFQGSLKTQQVLLRFAGGKQSQIMTIVSLDFRQEGWVVIGMPVESSRFIEHRLERILGVEFLEETESDPVEPPALPPMA